MTNPVYLCQGGCGNFAQSPADFQERGMVTPRLYCATCVVLVDEYLQKRDDLHTRVANEWADGLSALYERYAVPSEIRPQGMRLPDG